MKTPKQRFYSSNELSRIIESLAPDEQINLLKELSGKLVEWIKLEIMATPAYKKVCYSLQRLLQNFILQERFAEAIPILDVFSDIHTGLIKKENKVREVSREASRNWLHRTIFRFSLESSIQTRNIKQPRPLTFLPNSTILY